MLTQREIESAADRIDDRVRLTPVLRLTAGTFGVPVPLTLKLELTQHTGSFKPRGVFSRLLRHPQAAAAGVIAASGGNHGIAVAYAARELGLGAEVFLPMSASPVKVARLRDYGAEVTQVGQVYAEALRASEERAAASGALVVPAYDHWEVAAGQGTVGRELTAQADGDLDTVLVAVGGGGLLAGVATWFEGRARVVAVEPTLCPTLATALKIGQPTRVEVGGIAADSLGAPQVSTTALEVCQRSGVESVLVPDEAIRAARQLLWDEIRVTAEIGGACALAALTSGVYRPAPGERVAVIVCGGNTDPTDLASGSVG